MRTVIKSRSYRVKNISVEVSLVRSEQGNEVRFFILEKFQGSKYRNELVRGIFSDQGTARIEYKNVCANLERVLPVHIPELAY